MVDSNIFDKFLERADIRNKALNCKAKGLLRIVHTLIQRYENEEAEETKKIALREVRKSLSEEVVPYGLVNDDGHSLKVPFRCNDLGVDEPALGIENKTSPRGKSNSIDDIATFKTAKYENAIFVSQDEDARKKSKQHGVDSWSFEELVSKLESL
ncbi:hypothetical protein [Dendronalium sp. ChiSLP03b]|uniref:hypothetical protein n=1 Tax=Dendronalium sp. ChiSLP03b TaxID=3075381 RepID=UPI00391B2549